MKYSKSRLILVVFKASCHDHFFKIGEENADSLEVVLDERSGVGRVDSISSTTSRRWHDRGEAARNICHTRLDSGH